MDRNYLITGYWGTPHVTAENDRGIHAAIFGKGKYILPVGEKFKVEYMGNNTVRVYDGKLMVNGAAAGIPAGEYIDFEIPNAGQGMARCDYIVFQYSRDASTLVERGDFVLLHGEECEVDGDFIPPNYTTSDLLSGDATLDQLPICAVYIEGADIRVGSSQIPLLSSTLSSEPMKKITDCNHAVGTGFYYYDSDAANKPVFLDGAGCLMVCEHDYPYQYVQQAVSLKTGCKAQRRFFRNKDGIPKNSGWEYENPNATDDTEMPTTERWLGKCVYTKFIKYNTPTECGNLDSSFGFSLVFSTPNFESLIRYCGTISGGRTIPCFYNPEEGGGYIGVNFMNHQGLAIEMNRVTLPAGTTFNIQVWYTKTTDLPLELI